MPEANSTPVSPNLAGQYPGHIPAVAAKPKLLDRPLEVPHSRHSFATHLSEGGYNISERSGTVFAVAIMSQPQRAGFPLTLELGSTDLPKRSWVKISQIRTLSVERVGKTLGKVSPEELDQVVEGLNEIIGS